MTVVYRLIQTLLKTLSPWLPWREPLALEGVDAALDVPALLQARQASRILFFTDTSVHALEATQTLLRQLNAADLDITVIDATTPNPTTSLIDSIVAHITPPYDAMISLGGGSVIDTAKATAVAIAKPRATLYQLRGHFKVRKKLLFHIAIPTTAGSGSEATVATVLTEPVHERKFALMDLVLIPDVAVLDPVFQMHLPSSIAAMTGMDALTHAIEAYLSRSATAQTNAWALEAVRTLMTSLEHSVKHPSDLAARLSIQKAAYRAGCAFTRVYVGYVHALSHPLSALYHTPHGLANACLLPVVLKQYGSVIEPKMADIALTLQLPFDFPQEASRVVIEHIESLHQRLGLPTTLNGLKTSDYDRLIGFAKQEVIPSYPVPRYLSKHDMIACYDAVRHKGE